MPDDRRAGHAGPRLERFRAENPAAARSIEAALAEYERRLREASEHPETHLLECEHRYPGSALR
jgi:hypothetical protein